LETILIFISFYVGIYLIAFIVTTIYKLVTYFKYLNRLRSLAPEINSIDFLVADSELNRLDSLYSSTLSRIDDKYKILFSQEFPSVEQFVIADKTAQRGKRNNNKPRKYIFRRRY